MFFVYDSDPTKEHFYGLAHFRKISLKSWQFSKKSYWDFLSIFSAFFFHFFSLVNFLFFVYASEPTKEHFYVYSTFYKNLNQKLGPTLSWNFSFSANVISNQRSVVFRVSLAPRYRAVIVSPMLPMPKSLFDSAAIIKRSWLELN